MKLRIEYPATYNPILLYWNKIDSGEVIVGDKVRRIYKKLAADVFREDWKYKYSPSHGNHAIEFIENYCKHSKGSWGGKPIDMELWQHAFLAATFGFIDKETGLRKYREVLLVVARKNGKSTIASGIGLYLQVADGEAGAEIFACATKRDQAKLVWLEAKRMVIKSPVLRSMIKPLVSDLVSNWNDSSFKPLGADSETLDGLNVSGALLDEIHAWRDRNLYDVIVDGTSSRDQPLIVMITTAGTVREAVYDLKYEEAERHLLDIDDPEVEDDERFLPIIYELDKREEWTEPEAWAKANPGLGTIKKLDQLENKVNKAKKNNMLVKNLLCKDFNVRETSTEAWLTFEELNNTETFELKDMGFKYGIGGTDLSETTDLTAAKVIVMRKNDPIIYVLQMYWLPEDLLEKRVQEDGIRYDLWLERGLLRPTPGNRVHPRFVTEWYLEIQTDYGIYIPWIGYDRYSAIYWVEEMQGHFGKNALEPVAQGKQTLSGPMYLLGADLGAKLINYNNNPIDKWCLSNTAIDKDLKNQTIQPHKGSNQRRRIDGTAALLNAYVELERHREEYMNLL